MKGVRRAVIPEPLNEGEETLALQLRTARIPFQREFEFCPGRKWRFDFALPAKIAVEIEGGAYTQGRHTRGTGFVSDMEKYNAATKLGFKVLRYTPDQIKSGKPILEIAELLVAQ